MVEEPSPDSEAGAPENVTTELKSWQALGLAVTGIVTVCSQLWLAVTKDWRVSLLTVFLALFAYAAYTFARKRLRHSPLAAAAVRYGAIALFVAIPVTSIAALLFYSVVPRLTREDANTIAVAQFAGAPLPSTYQWCRPSAALVNALNEVQERFQHLNAFEGSYVIEPDTRFSAFWARAYGWIDSADVIVYGSYTLSRSQRSSTDPDQITITPKVDAVPIVPLGEHSAPLYRWYLPERNVPLEELCSGQGTSGKSQFLEDAERIALAIVAAQRFGHQEFLPAGRALAEAKRNNTDEQSCSYANSLPPCPGILEYYLGSLDLQFGRFDDAKREYEFAAGSLNQAAPFISLAELDMDRGDRPAGFANLDKAVQTDPTSVAALSTRAMYEFDNLRGDDAMVDLDRALHLPPVTAYDAIALSRAVYDRDSTCGIQALAKAINRSDFDRRAMIDSYVRYGYWIRKIDPQQSLAVLTDALQIDPYDVKAHYTLGFELASAPNNQPDRARVYYRRAVDDPVFNDDQLLDRANAANELRLHFDGPDEVQSDLTVAENSYREAIAMNPANAAYAHWELALLYQSLRDTNHQGSELRAAVESHPNDVFLLGSYVDFLTAQKSPQARVFAARLEDAKGARTPADEEKAWSHATCSYG